MQTLRWKYFSAWALIMVIFMATALAAETVKIGGTGGALGVMRVLGDAYKKDHPTVDVVVVAGLGSGGGRKALMGGALDLAVTSRPGKAVEKLDGANARLYGRSPFVFAVPAKNSINNLTIQEIIDIFGGKKITWPNGERLRLILRPLTDSDSEILFNIGSDMERALKAAHQREGMSMAITDEESANLIESTPGAIGSSTTCLILAEKRALKALSVKGVAPSAKSIADGAYPWFKSFYVVNKMDGSAAARSFAEFVTSARGEQLIAKLGHWLPEAAERR